LKQSALTKKPFELAPVVRGSPEPSPGGERCTICTCGTKKACLYFIVVKCSLAAHHNVFCHTAGSEGAFWSQEKFKLSSGCRISPGGAVRLCLP
jgi:hypothetical protein